MNYDFEEKTAEEKKEELLAAIDTLNELYAENKETFHVDWRNAGTGALKAAVEWIDKNLLSVDETDDNDEKPYPFPSIPSIAALESHKRIRGNINE